MGRRLRLWETDKIYSCTERTIDRQFLFRPDHNPRNRLLRWDCPQNALDPDNDIIPKPSIINIIGSAIVRALKKHPVDIYWFEGNINHLHDSVGVIGGNLDNVSRFKQTCNSLIAKGLKDSIDREGHAFGAPFRSTPCISDASAEQQLFYSVTNVVKDGLVEKVSQSPFFTTYRHLAQGEPLEFWWIDWARYWKAGGKANKRLRVKDFLRWGSFELTVLPDWKDLTEQQRRTRFRKGVRDLEEMYAQQRKDQQRNAMGTARLFELDPRDRPRNPKQSARQPLCHASSKKKRVEFARQWRDFVNEHRKASADFLNGYWEREFPEGSFRPPILKIYTSSRL